ncbi:MAG: NUDIX hydrolase [Candidatus Methanosuratincola sp.]|jgi:8-oxo-dGTP pyrophosphatase MutT (NUDIX family)
MVKEWEARRSEKLNSLSIFSTRKDYCVSPTTGIEHPFYVLETPTWVNVIAITPSDEMVLIRQFRHGTRTITIEIPGGSVDEGEAPLEAAKRELLEETGYASCNWLEIGVVHPNPAFQDNVCYTYLAQGAEKVADQNTDGTEEIEVFLAPAGDVIDYIASGRITHSIVIAALFWYHMFREHGVSLSKACEGE